MAKSRAMQNRAIRQQALREQLAEQCRLQHIIDNIIKMEKLESGDNALFELNKLKTANEQRLRLLNKYLPDLKSTEITGEGGGSVTIETITFVSPDADSTS